MANYNKPWNYTSMAGQRFGTWTVLNDGHRKYGRVHCLVRCDCGEERIVAAQTLKNGTSKNCGCAGGKPLERHGMSRTQAYKNYSAMISRCNNPKNVGYPYYGGKGVRVCERWATSFAAFVEDMGERPTRKHTVDRIDNSKGYEPGNCRWATQQEQCRNQHHPYVDLIGRRDPRTGKILPKSSLNLPLLE
jgi:hypothetical protein